MSGIATAQTVFRRRGSSSSTVKASHPLDQPLPHAPRSNRSPSVFSTTAWVHDDSFSSEDILINESILEGSGIQEGTLIEITSVQDAVVSRDFQPTGDQEAVCGGSHNATSLETAAEKTSRWICLARFAKAELKAKQANLQVSIKSTIATAFGFRQGSQIRIRPASVEESTASHVEFNFRDTYLARSDMWRLIGQELSGKPVYTGQRITFLGSIRLIVKAIHVNGHKATTAYFSGLTLPIFRSEAARYVIFVQMSQEMWDFDSEGNGEILFNR
ncbi:MAG: vacuolar membrane-associated protein iml1, partial [Watsoniomyces obsoletus]